MERDTTQQYPELQEIWIRGFQTQISKKWELISPTTIYSRIILYKPQIALNLESKKGSEGEKLDFDIQINDINTQCTNS